MAAIEVATATTTTTTTVSSSSAPSPPPPPVVPERSCCPPAPKKKKLEPKKKKDHVCRKRLFSSNVFDDRMEYITNKNYSLQYNLQLVDWKSDGDFTALVLLHMHILANIVKENYKNFCVAPKLCPEGNQMEFCDSEHCRKDNPNCQDDCKCKDFCEICAFVKPYFSLEKNQEKHWANVNFYEPAIFREPIMMYACNFVPRYVRNVTTEGHEHGIAYNWDLNELTMRRAAVYFEYRSVPLRGSMNFMDFMITLINRLDDHFKPLIDVNGSDHDQRIIKSIMGIPSETVEIE